jgi:hypothetical protein
MKNTIINYLNARYEIIAELGSTKLNLNDLINYGWLSLPKAVTWKEIHEAANRVIEIHSKDKE